MNCEQAQQRLVDRWIEGIDEARRIELDTHMAGCPECRQESERLTELWHSMAMMPEEEPSRRMRSTIHQMLEAYQLGAGAGARKPRNWWQSLQNLWPRQPLVQFAMAGAAMVFGLIAGHLYTARTQDQQTIAQLNVEMQNMRQLVTLSLLQQQSANERLKGVTYSVRMEQTGNEVLTALLTTLTQDTNVNVRLAAVDALRQHSAQTAVRRGLRDAILLQDSPLVQVALIDWAMETKDRGSLQPLNALLQREDLNPSVKPRLMRAIGQLQNQ